MFEERLRDIILSIYSGRVLVFSTITARETLFAKGLTPAIFLHKYYTQNMGEARIGYNLKERTVKQMCQLCPIDQDQIESFREEKMNKVIKERIGMKTKLPKEVTKADLTSKNLIQNYLKSLNFFWFEQATHIFLYCLSLDENNFRVSTLEQPLGLTFVIQIGPGVNVKSQYEKVRKQADIKLKKIFALNPSRTKNISVLVILLYNSQKGGSLSQMKSLQDSLKHEYSLQNGLVCLVEINGSNAKDSVEWSSYPRVVIKHDYKLQPSDPVRLIGDKEDQEIRQFVSNHRDKIRQNLEDRLRWLCSRYEENNTAKNKFFNFFKTSQTDRSYTPEETQNRQIADILFLLGDYKRSLDLYKDLSEKFESASRQAQILFNVSEMVQVGKFICAISGGNKIKAYNSIQKYADKHMFKRAHGIGKIKMHKYLVYMTYFIHGLKVFERDFIKNSFYLYVKRCVNEQSASEQNPYPSLVPSLVHEQYANLNLLYPIPEHRRYAYDIVRVASKFSQFRLFDHHLRCLLIASYIYEGTFPTIEKYINSALSRTYLELKKYRFSVERIQHTWKALLQIYQDTHNENEEENQFTKLYANQSRLLSEIERLQPQELTRQTEDCIPVPKILEVLVQVWDEGLQGAQTLGSKWQDVGDVFLGQPQLTSKGMSKQNLIKMLKLFDAITPQEKQLAYRVRNLPTGQIPEALLKRNTRQSFVGEPIMVAFDMKNYLPLTIEVSAIKLHLKVNRRCRMNLVQPSGDKVTLKQGQKVSVMFQVVPEEAGLLQFSHISWTFFKMTSIHKFKEPWESKSALKNLYYKLNVLEKTAKLKVKIKHKAKFYEGQHDEVQIQLTNEGNQTVEDIYLAVDSKAVFGFNMKRLEVQVKAGQSKSIVLPIKMPLLHATDFMKSISKTIFLYRAGNTFRVTRSVISFNVQRIAQIENIICEKISTSLHFLSFSIKYASTEEQQISLLKSMALHQGLEIKKVETNHLGALSHFFFFLRKNPETTVQEYSLVPQKCSRDKVFRQAFEKQVDLGEGIDSSIRLFFLWQDKQGQAGIISPQPVKITATDTTYNMVKLPFNAKVLLQDTVQCDFNNEPFAQVQVEVIIKNIFNMKDINLTVQFTQGMANDFFWQGVTEHHLCLAFNQEKVIRLSLLLTRPGLFNVARNIRYTILLNKTNSYQLHHSDYENIYIEGKSEGPTEQVDFFQQISPSAFKKPIAAEQSLI